MIYGYIRVSTMNQNLERQRDNIKQFFPEAIIYEEKFSGKTDYRPIFQKLIKNVHEGDTIVFDEVSRMSRNASEGFRDYKMLFDRGVGLMYLKEPQINSDVYKSALETSIELTGNEIADVYIEATNKVLMIIAEKQIKAAFEHAEKERELLSRRTKEGMAKGRKAGRKKGVPQHQKKEDYAKRIIRKNNKAFGGSLNNKETMKLAGISAPTFYKYIKELFQSER